MHKVIHKLINAIFIGLLFGFWGCMQPPIDFSNKSQLPSHQLLDSLLTIHVENNGKVDYQGFIKDSVHFGRYLEQLKLNPPDTNTWSREEQMAYWINAYNAFTIKLIIDNYPVKSIKDLNPTISVPFVNSIWDVKFIDLGGKKFSLNNIEHDILRGHFKDARIHFAINCASISCPRLLNKAYFADSLDQVLDKQAVDFINDKTKNEISIEHIKVSKIFLWFSGDFKKNGTLIDFLNRYADVQIKKTAEVDYMAYNWLLNSK